MARWMFALLAFLHFALCNCELADALDELPAEIPSGSVVTSELLDQMTRSVSRVADFDERFDVLQTVLHDVYSIPAEQRQALTDLFERDVQQVASEQRLISARTSINIASPQLAVKLARQIKEERFHDAWLSDLVRYYSSRDDELAQQLLAEIKNPLARAQTMVWMAEDERLKFQQARSILLDAKQLGLNQPVSPHLVRFAHQHFDEVLGMIRTELQVEEAVSLLSREAAARRYKGDEPELAQRLMAAAVDLIPNSMAPATATRTVLMNGYADQDRQHALELYEKHLLEWVPKLRVDEFTDLHLVLARTELWQGLEDLEQLATNDVARSRLLLTTRIVGRAAAMHGPGDALDWLRSAAGPIRNASVAPIAWGLNDYAANQRVEGAQVQEWVEVLAKFAMKIADPTHQWTTFEAIRRLAEDHSAALPAVIQNRRAALAAKNKKFKEALLREASSKHPLERQRQAINYRLYGPDEYNSVPGRIKETAKMASRSTLPLEEKRHWFDRLLNEARALSDAKESTILLSDMGFALGNFDASMALRVHAESISLARQLGMKPRVNAIPTTDNILEGTFRDYTGNVDDLIQLLWSFARNLESDDDRNATLDAIGKLLIKHKNYERAAGIASLLTIPQRQARLLGEIVAAQSGKAPND